MKSPMDLVRPSCVIRRWRGPWGLRKSAEAVAVGVALAVTLSLLSALRQPRSGTLGRSSGCQFPAIFNFGDSNSDTGSESAMFHRIQPPNGRTFFGKPSGRYCDGRLIIDFIAQKLGLPYLSAYLDAIDSNFRHGANFAASGSTIQPANVYNGEFNPISLDIQLLQFEQLKERTFELYQDKKSYDRSSFPRPEDFSKALYTIDSGQNDLHAGLISMTEEQVQKYIPNIIDRFALAVEKLYQNGARAFWIHNTGPIGCLPYFVMCYPPKAGNVDQIGCVKSYNEVAEEFNKQLKERVSQIKDRFQDALLTYVDIYSAKYSLISQAKTHGFVNPLGYCRFIEDYRLECGQKAVMNKTQVYGDSFCNPLEFISWDGIHWTEAANQWVANHILDGSLSNPRASISEACQKHV